MARNIMSQLSLIHRAVVFVSLKFVHAWTAYVGTADSLRECLCYMGLLLALAHVALIVWAIVYLPTRRIIDQANMVSQGNGLVWYIKQWRADKENEDNNKSK